jgi:hypothetical protein
LLFQINYQLCREFTGLTPFVVDDRRYADVIKLYAEVIDLHAEVKKQQDPNRVIRRRAGDDWF